MSFFFGFEIGFECVQHYNESSPNRLINLETELRNANVIVSGLTCVLVAWFNFFQREENVRMEKNSKQ